MATNTITAGGLDPVHVPSTLTRALAAIAHHEDRGFTFARTDLTERFVSFAEIVREANRRAAYLAGLGLKKGDRAAVIMAEGDDFVLAFLGCVVLGVVPVPIYPMAMSKNLASYHEVVRHIQQASGAKVLLAGDSVKEVLEPTLVSAQDSAGIGFATMVLASALAAAPDAGTPSVEVLPEDTCFMQFTSGSTAKPKGVVVSHRNLAWNSECFMVHGLGKNSATDKGVSWLPLFHDMGLIGFVIGPLFTDIQVAFMPTASFVRAPRRWLEMLHRHRGTITYAPNFAYALVAKRVKEKDLEGLDLSCVKHAGCGAEPIQAATLREFAEKLAPAGFNPAAFLPSYGMAEATLAITFSEQRGNGDAYVGIRTDAIDQVGLEHGRATAKVDGQVFVNCGRAFPSHEIAIASESGEFLPERQVGQIVAKGPSMAEGYYQNPEATAEAFRGEWLYTGDLGYLVNGEVFVCGRLKDMVIIRGRNFYPNDIEWAVSELPKVRRGNVVAFGVQVGDSEELVICAEALQSDSEALANDIAERVTERFNLVPHRVDIVPQGSLPQTSSGKPQRRKTKQMFLNGTFDKIRAEKAATKSSDG
jgi:fatty-acyl-CoA synthase